MNKYDLQTSKERRRKKEKKKKKKNDLEQFFDKLLSESFPLGAQEKMTVFDLKNAPQPSVKRIRMSMPFENKKEENDRGNNKKKQITQSKKKVSFFFL